MSAVLVFVRVIEENFVPQGLKAMVFSSTFSRFLSKETVDLITYKVSLFALATRTLSLGPVRDG